ncbi:MAG TPA: DUF5686 family protein [Rhodothermales bacterium]|nr:DUF5686 family protein [Rhodothermales bacterium]
MTVRLRRLCCCLLVLCLATPSFAQETTRPDTYRYERSVIESALGTVVRVIREAVLQGSTPDLDSRLRAMTERLSYPAAAFAPASGVPLTSTLPADSLARLSQLLRETYADVQSLRREAQRSSRQELAQRLASVEVNLQDALDLADGIAVAAPDAAEEDEHDEWLQPGAYGAPVAHADTRADTFRLGSSDRHWHSRDEQKSRRLSPVGLIRHSGLDSFLGRYPNSWPYAEAAVYRVIPAIRYNRVEGFVLGIASSPLDWDSPNRSKIIGQAGYAFGLHRGRFEAGAEHRFDIGDTGARALKIGAVYRYNTATEDLWKSNWIENTLASLLFENDFFDYYQVRGWSAYAVQRISPYLNVSAGFRSEDNSSLENNTHWSLFGGDFRPNPPASEGRVNSLLFAVEGGKVRSLNYLPIGFAFRVATEIAPGLGGDFSFSRSTADGRAYLPVTATSSLALRLRGGLVEGDDAPTQKSFTLGGIGSVRGYPQNSLFGTRMLLGNVEYMVDNIPLPDDVFEDLEVFGFVDGGWMGYSGTRTFNTGDLLGSVGVGVSLDERNLRFELAWPLKDAGFGMAPSLWFRLSPSL